MNSRRKLVLALGAGAVIVPLGSFAQQAGKLPRIGLLIAGTPSSSAERINAFKLKLRELGYVEGTNILIDSRWAEGKLDRLPALAAELMRLNVDVLVTGGPADTRVAKETSGTLPIVMTFDPDPVANGFIATLARPGGNITGLSTLAPEVSGKQLELLKEVVRGLSRVAVLGSSLEPGNGRVQKEMEQAARSIKVQLQSLDVRNPADIEPAFSAATKGRADAIIVLQTPFTDFRRTQLIELAAKNRVPAIYPRSTFVEEGGLLSYGVNLTELGGRAAVYVDKILKGAKPADLPVEQPRVFEFALNLKTAKTLGLTIPQSLLISANKVVG